MGYLADSDKLFDKTVCDYNEYCLTLTSDSKFIAKTCKGYFMLKSCLPSNLN